MNASSLLYTGYLTEIKSHVSSVMTSVMSTVIEILETLYIPNLCSKFFFGFENTTGFRVAL